MPNPANPEKKSDAENKQPTGGGLALSSILPATPTAKAFKKAAKAKAVTKPATGNDKGKKSEVSAATPNTY